MSRRRAAIVVTGLLTITRYALIADTAYRAATAQADGSRVLLIGLMTVMLWGLNGIGLVVLFRSLVKRIRHD